MTIEFLYYYGYDSDIEKIYLSFEGLHSDISYSAKKKLKKYEKNVEFNIYGYHCTKKFDYSKDKKICNVEYFLNYIFLRNIKTYLIKNQKTISIEILNHLVKFDEHIYKYIVYDKYILNNIYKSNYFYKWYKPKTLKETLIKNINLKKIEYKNCDMLMKY